MGYSRMEQETSIVWDDEEKVAHIYTASPVSMRMLDRLCEGFPGEYAKVWEERDGEGRVTAARYETHCKRIRFAKPASEARREQGRRIAALAAEKRREWNGYEGTGNREQGTGNGSESEEPVPGDSF